VSVLQEDALARAVADHYRSVWGEPSRWLWFQIEGHYVEVHKWDATAGTNPEGVALYATMGSSVHPLDGHDPSHRMEFYIGLLPEKDEVMSTLAALATYPAIFKQAMGQGHSLDLPGPVWPGTEMHRFLVLGPYEKILPTLNLPDGTRVEFLQAIAIYESELEFRKKHGLDSLRRLWVERDVSFEDPSRPPALGVEPATKPK